MRHAELVNKSEQIRLLVLETIVSAKKGHIGGAFSCIDILVALYYGSILSFDPKRPLWCDRDRFILSKGHSGVALFAILADLGFITSSELHNFCKNGNKLGGHPDRRICGIEADTGSLGHGLGIGVGMGLAARMDDKDYRTVVLIGDGECYEGSVWEAAMYAGHQKLTNLTAIVDRNGQCVTDFTEDCNRIEPLADKWRAFGWEVRDINGHDFGQILQALSDTAPGSRDKPLAVIARTIKGKGVSFMEKRLRWHHGVPKGPELETARKELGQKRRAIS